MQSKSDSNSLPWTAIEAISCSLAFGLLAISYFCVSSEAFQRSGALLVCIAIMIGLVDFGKQIDKSIIATLDKMIKMEKDNYSKFFQQQLVEQVKNPSLFYEESIKDPLYQKYYQDLQKRIYRVEACIAIAGTLVWAFGDLL